MVVVVVVGEVVVLNLVHQPSGGDTFRSGIRVHGWCIKYVAGYLLQPYV